MGYSNKAFGRLLFLILIICIVFPIIWGISISLKNRVDALATPPKWIFTPTLSNYNSALMEGDYGNTIINSLIIALSSSILAMMIGIPAAYMFSRFNFRGARAAFLGILTVRMAPATVIALPLFLIFSKLRLIDTYLAIILVHTAVALALVIWIMKAFFDEVPLEIDEASLIDGTGRVRILATQVLPLCLPGVAVTAALCFINSWNEFFLALMLTGFYSRPYTVAVPALVSPHGTYWGQVTAIATIGLIPAVLFAIIVRYFIIGFTQKKLSAT
ncbi:MAG: carbohydrate ABC transporter permease [Candidatus Zixiibacteriota bacterium]